MIHESQFSRSFVDTVDGSTRRFPALSILLVSQCIQSPEACLQTPNTRLDDSSHIVGMTLGGVGEFRQVGGVAVAGALGLVAVEVLLDAAVPAGRQVAQQVTLYLVKILLAHQWFTLQEGALPVGDSVVKVIVQTVARCSYWPK